jgi:peptidoglycan/xylan/chitin deacetylase (PgdA/CDA1 family)
MARRHLATLVLAALALGLGACQAANAGTSTDSWHAPLAAPGDSAQPSSVPPPSHAPTKGPTKAKAPSPSPSQSQSQSNLPDNPQASPSGGMGPARSITTTGTSDVALTFDDGPDAYSMQVLDLLAEYHVKATFCIIGRQVAAHPDVIRRIVADGHTLCNHTWDHDLMLRNRTEAQIRTEMQSTNDAIHAVVPDAKISYFRAPGGGFSPQIVQLASDLGMKSLYWQVDPQDWTCPGAPAIVNRVIGHTHPGSIVLMHDGGGNRSQTVEALRTILPNFTSRFTLIPLPA